MTTTKVWTVRRVVETADGSLARQGWQAATYRVVERARDGMPSYRFDEGVGPKRFPGKLSDMPSPGSWQDLLDGNADVSTPDSVAHALAKQDGQGSALSYVEDAKHNAMAVTLDWLLAKLFEPPAEAAYRLNGWPRLFMMFKPTSKSRYNLGVAVQLKGAKPEHAIFMGRLGNVTENQLDQIALKVSPPVFQAKWRGAFPLKSSAGKRLVMPGGW
jgi:hypothetical protein